ncbi:MAG TPA: glycerophosphodiester phosphodiesterase [Thermoanaerobaculia bacterium]|nr:glycerophosphodiester phosphodiesterase [Thermoanaerobaculia bacterium]
MKLTPPGRRGPPPGRSLSLPGREKPYVMAHRGNRTACPENTLASFRRALEDGADVLETDLWLSTDGVFVCIHDATLERTTDGRGPVEARSLAELKALSAGCGRPEFASERIPTLAELCALVPPDRGLALELKSDRFLDPEVGGRLGEELEALGVLERCVVLSFSRARLEACRRGAPRLPTGWITLKESRPVPGTELLGPYWPLLLLNPLYVALAHRRGQAVAPLDPSPARRLWLWKLLRCDAVLTDDPAETVRQLGRRPPRI